MNLGRKCRKNKNITSNAPICFEIRGSVAEDDKTGKDEPSSRERKPEAVMVVVDVAVWDLPSSETHVEIEIVKTLAINLLTSIDTS
ncbi:hypothetical protein E2C01_024956 [Portunus trituberculatus]|uniref:Uncharacterized protein n=1 Tax=Portunus trituberculatus TaxID=210409 RepID=A0A5B7EBT3_PORTR|nr:hypothetical protein [Portunus trituberculatus]